MPQTPVAQALKVFVVEDSLPLRERLLEMLGSIEGVDATGSAEGSDAAVREILAARPDTVLLDVNLAQGSGFDVLRAVQGTAPEVEVWMLTNFSSEPYRRACRRLGAARFFDKTTEFEQVREHIAARAAYRNTH